MGKELPKNWVICKLDELARIQSGGTPSRSNSSYWNGDIPWIKISDIKSLSVDRATEYITEKGLKNSSATLFPKGTILFTIFATIGRIGVLEIEATTNQAIAGITPSELINKKYITYSLLELSSSILREGKGVAQKNINQTILKNILIPLPPLPEQTRIVVKLDQLFGQLEQIKESLDKIPQLLKDFRQQVLTQAVTGKLTAEWREGRNLENWKSNLLGECCKITMGQSPPGSTYNDVGEGVPLINGPVEFGGIDPFSKTKKVKFTTKPTKFCEVNDLLICVRGSTTGRINISGFRACIGRGVAAIKAKKLSQEYVNIFMRLQYAKILSMGTGSTFPSISGDFLRNYEINVPPKKEQQEIVNRVETLFAKADTLQQQYQTLKQKIETLPQAILHKAFKGELVPQLESDGDARELLEEIKALKKHTAKPISKKPKAYKVYDVELGRVAEDGKEYSKK